MSAKIGGVRPYKKQKKKRKKQREKEKGAKNKDAIEPNRPSP